MPSRAWSRRGGAELDEAQISSLIQELKVSTQLAEPTLRICILRGFRSAADIQKFFTPRLEDLTPFGRIADMSRAVERIAAARQKQQKIRIFADYDVDGTTGAALLSWFFRDLGLRYDARQPDRFRDGYGLGTQAVEEAQRDGVGLLITVDCGISSFAALELAQARGLDVIVVDHHQIDPERQLPPAWAILNPQRPDCESQLRELCGCGLAFYLAMALRAYGRSAQWFIDRPEPNLKQHLDLVVLATAADMVPLVKDNHILVRYGLEVLRQTKKPGILALLKTARVDLNRLSPSHLGFTLGPRINASGRMHNASIALELLITMDEDRARDLAQQIEDLNVERSSVQNQIWDEVRCKIEGLIAQGNFTHGIVVSGSWHEGVVGIVASRITETFKRPAAVIARRADFGKGSVRAYGGQNVLRALQRCRSSLIAFGGHPNAAGLSVGLDQIEAFALAFDQALGEIPLEQHAHTLWIEGECTLTDLSLETLEEIERLGPFGPGNPEPVFAVRAHLSAHRILKERHLKLYLTPARSFTQTEAIWFNALERADLQLERLRDQEHQWACVPEVNRFGGATKASLRIRDFRPIVLMAAFMIVMSRGLLVWASAPGQLGPGDSLLDVIVPPTPQITPSSISAVESNLRATPTPGRLMQPRGFLLFEFEKAQKAELKLLEKQRRADLDRLKKENRQQLAAFDAQEVILRKAYFVEHTKGPERRAYMHDHFKRRGELEQIQTNTLAELARSYAERIQQLKSTHRGHLQSFLSALGQNLQPSPLLWPPGSAPQTATTPTPPEASLSK